VLGSAGGANPIVYNNAPFVNFTFFLPEPPLAASVRLHIASPSESPGHILTLDDSLLAVQSLVELFIDMRAPADGVIVASHTGTVLSGSNSIRYTPLPGVEYNIWIEYQDQLGKLLSFFDLRSFVCISPLFLHSVFLLCTLTFSPFMSYAYSFI
jgi:hypothetical protein